MSKDKVLDIEDIKKALLPSIAELFEHHSDKTSKKFEALDRKFTDKIDHLGTLMEQTAKKIDTALEFTDATTEHTITLKDHSKRIKKVEAEVTVINKAIKQI